jgi:hypothetical protein
MNLSTIRKAIELWGLRDVARMLNVPQDQVAKWARGDTDQSLSQSCEIPYGVLRLLQQYVREPWPKHQHQLYCDALFALAQKRQPASPTRWYTDKDEAMICINAREGDPEAIGDVPLPRERERLALQLERKLKKIH